MRSLRFYQNVFMHKFLPVNDLFLDKMCQNQVIKSIVKFLFPILEHFFITFLHLEKIYPNPLRLYTLHSDQTFKL